MKVAKSAGLVGAGGVNQSFLARMPALLGTLGPVRGSSLRVSRRIANGLKAGVGVADYSAFGACDIIWIAVPEQTLDTVSADLAGGVCLQGKTIVLCDVLRDSFHPGPLRAAGARVATLNCVPESDESVFAGEGHRGALTVLRKMLARDGRRLVEIQPFCKTLYWSGIFLAKYMLFPWIDGAVESFRAAGLTRDQAARMVLAIGGRALRSYMKTGKTAWNPVEAAWLQDRILEDLDAIRFHNSRTAALYGNEMARLLTLSAKKRPAQRAARIDRREPDKVVSA